MPKSTTKEDGEKQFSLKQIELNVLVNIDARHQAEQLDFLSFIAIERLAYPVTVRTRFRFDEKNNLYISEIPEEPEVKEEVAVS